MHFVRQSYPLKENLTTQNFVILLLKLSYHLIKLFLVISNSKVFNKCL